MAKNKKETLRNRVRAAVSRKGALNALNELRGLAPSNYLGSIESFRHIAVLDAALLLRLGPSEFGHLLWNYRPLIPLSLKNELAWAISWLKGQSTKINAYRYFSLELQELVMAGKMNIAAVKLDDFCARNGWSFWAVELRIALEQSANGTDAQKSLATIWKLSAPNKIASLIAQIVSDRNDPTYSYDAFCWNCLNSFPSFNDSDWLSSYLFYRSLGHLEDVEKSLPVILSRELTSSLIDYYEAILESLFRIAEDTDNLQFLRPDAIRVIDALLSDGYRDHRLRKLRIALTGIMDTTDDNILTPNNSTFVQLVSDACMARAHLGDTTLKLSPFLEGIIEDIRQCNEKGNQAQDAITSIVKLGVNLKSLDIGITIANSQALFTKDITSEDIFPLGMMLVTSNWEFDDVAALDDELVKKFLESSAQNNYYENHHKASKILNVVNGQSVETLEVSNELIYLWLSRQLLRQQRWEEALLLSQCLSQFGSFWSRQSAKIHIGVLVEKGELKNALELITVWLLKGSHYASEFPISKIFIGRSWSAFADIDPVLVGLVSHHAYIVTEDQDIHYICKKACRALAIKGGRILVAEQFNATNDENERAKLIAFIKDVWIEANFALIEQIESTEDARNEQMEVMQLLMQWDEENSADYVDFIKELTLDQTLRNGLKQIDQTRVFVNEVALYRWAEKELYQDYERWTNISKSQLNAVLVDDLVRQYLVNPNDLDLLQALGHEPTEADALLIKLIERLFERFLHDPLEGLDCYLSLRIRHGSLRGTLFGALAGC